MMLRGTNRMQAGYYENPGSIDAVVETVRETRQQKPPGATVDSGVGTRKGKDRINSRIDRVDELVAETRPLELIPVTCLRHIGDCRSEKPGTAHANQPRSRRLASSQEMTASSSFSSASSLRSSTFC